MSRASEPEVKARTVRRSARRKLASESVDSPVALVPDAAAPSEQQRREAVARAAYFRAERRGFEPGHELDDWLAAEAEIALAEIAQARFAPSQNESSVASAAKTSSKTRDASRAKSAARARPMPKQTITQQGLGGREA